jgi:hypothetical protein
LKYQVLRKLRWRGKNYQRGDVLTPRNQDEEYRCNILVETGFLAPAVSDELLKNLAAAGVRVGQRVRRISEVSEADDDV